MTDASAKVRSPFRPEVLSKISRLELRARYVADGFLAGMHRSPYKGFSVEFANHRAYVPGDDLRHLDWRVYARADRLYVKEYEVDTNFVLDDDYPDETDRCSVELAKAMYEAFGRDELLEALKLYELLNKQRRASRHVAHEDWYECHKTASTAIANATPSGASA